MGRILAIDYGTRRTGVAVSDPLRIIATALATVPTAELESWIAQYLDGEDVQTIVVGRPLQMNGRPSDAWAQIAPFVERLRKRYPEHEVVLWDERFTSLLAQRTIRESGVGRMARRDKGTVDRVSATIILQGYMEALLSGHMMKNEESNTK